MKNTFIILTIIIIAVISCSTPTTQNRMTDFIAYEIIPADQIPVSILDSLNSFNFLPENNTERLNFGYLPEADSTLLSEPIKFDSIVIMRFSSTVGDAEQYFPLYALKSKLTISATEIKELVSNNGNTEIQFDIKGTQKWADYTASHTGKSIAFVISGQVKDATLIGGRINNGVVLIRE